nr:histidine phosphatase family protein [Akkermansiaceae bacterium]
CSSPLLRARQTSDVVSSETGLPVRCTDRLLEVDLGDLDGRAWSDGRPWEAYETVRQAWEGGCEDTPLPGGESLSEVRERLYPLLTDPDFEHAAGVLLVGHGVLFMSLLWLFCPNRAPTLQGNYMQGGHLTRLAPEKAGWRIEEFNVPPPGHHTG